ncbi:uncharacterized protein ACA1_251510 [Acanthamoeba castellanii str. Neff]|uniref:Uncharacterized protein n=1 Tax=Acanthamoeba castellanii (strain ATCC 30010 / Neff) TaxID=1257118 RepID=L8H9S1_ACACF|nr:uncharacterized protein ACA1_251510 [Acanthamoeba castellanii str. Neff]ELR22269.1 hypothetical protein ACA1_251510 [Acanthamoeba castellanii str. Neff]
MGGNWYTPSAWYGVKYSHYQVLEFLRAQALTAVTGEDNQTSEEEYVNDEEKEDAKCASDNKEEEEDTDDMDGRFWELALALEPSLVPDCSVGCKAHEAYLRCEHHSHKDSLFYIIRLELEESNLTAANLASLDTNLKPRLAQLIAHLDTLVGKPDSVITPSVHMGV